MPTNTDSTYFKVRSFFRAQILNLLGMYSKPAPGIHILNGHRIENEAEPETFRSLLSELSKEVKFVRFEDAVEMIERHENPKDPWWHSLSMTDLWSVMRCLRQYLRSSAQTLCSLSTPIM